jgi:hypothetical protein
MPARSANAPCRSYDSQQAISGVEIIWEGLLHLIPTYSIVAVGPVDLVQQCLSNRNNTDGHCDPRHLYEYGTYYQVYHILLIEVGITAELAKINAYFSIAVMLSATLG